MKKYIHIPINEKIRYDMYSIVLYYVETIALLSKLNAKQNIEVELNMDELDLTTSEAKSTYQEFKDYIFEKYRIKVSSLYMAQVIKKHDIIETDCYNKQKSEQTVCIHKQ